MAKVHDVKKMLDAAMEGKRAAIYTSYVKSIALLGTRIERRKEELKLRLDMRMRAIKGVHFDVQRTRFFDGQNDDPDQYGLSFDLRTDYRTAQTLDSQIKALIEREKKLAAVTAAHGAILKKITLSPKLTPELLTEAAAFCK